VSQKKKPANPIHDQTELRIAQQPSFIAWLLTALLLTFHGMFAVTRTYFSSSEEH